MLGDESLCVRGRCDHGVGATRMARRQLRVVSADFSACPLRIEEEEQIVDRHDLRRVSRRDQQRMRGVHDIGVAGERFDGRPLDAMPQVIQYRDGHAAIDDARAQLAGH